MHYLAYIYCKKKKYLKFRLNMLGVFLALFCFVLLNLATLSIWSWKISDSMSILDFTIFHMEWKTFFSLTLYFPKEGIKELSLPTWWVSIQDIFMIIFNL